MEQEKAGNGVQQSPEPPPAADVKPETKKEARSAVPKKELTPAEMQKRKKMLIMPLFFLVFGAAMWLIFAPSGGEKEQQAQQAGLNAELPMPKEDGLIGDKRDAYEQEAMRQKEQEKMQSLQDFAFMLDESGNPQPQQEADAVDESPSYSGGSSYRQPTASIQSSTAAYRDINRQLGAWYEQPATEVDEQAQLALEWRIQELERRQEEAELRKKTEDDQLAMMEKSYQLAAKYMPQAAGTSPSPAPPEAEGAGTAANNAAGGNVSGKVVAQPVRQVRPNTVSLLAAPVSDAEFIREYSKPRNIGFLTAAGSESESDKNSIRACVYQTVTLSSGKELQIRLMEPMRAGNMLIPAGTVITGICRITGERLDVTVNSIQYADNIIPVELLVYDTDGQRGVFVPGNDEINAVKEVASTLASSAGTSIMISDNAGSQLAADMGKGLIQGASQYVGKKMSVVKVTLKAGYKLLLLPKVQ